MARGQAERLLPLLEEVLAAGGAVWNDLAGLAVCTGPGNFTGVRIGVAAARGLAMALGRRAVGVTRLEALAKDWPGEVLVVLDARRGAFFTQRFIDGRAVTTPELTAPERLAERTPGALRLGFGAAEAEAAETPDPATIARIAAARLGMNAPPPAPLYLRAADAAPSAEAPPRMLDDA
jgi:tRNA threonylcarbamoyladenosine biosynthesis protein TsaB